MPAPTTITSGRPLLGIGGEYNVAFRKTHRTGGFEEVGGYSRAVRSGNLIAVSGTAAIDSSGVVVSPGDVGAQTSEAFDIALAAVNILGGAVGDVIRTRIYLVAGSEIIARVGSVRFTAYAMATASVVCIAQFFLLRPLAALDLPAPVYLYAIGMALVSTVIPSFMTSEALQRIGANKVAIIGALGPVTAIALGYLGLDEIMTPLQIAGAALVLVGVVVISLKPKSFSAGRR